VIVEETAARLLVVGPWPLVLGRGVATSCAPCKNHFFAMSFLVVSLRSTPRNDNV
jgi:hypothetical protein